ncbi:MAG: HyaD/HybD family hydrogenase maturation endopeptidase [Arcobacteraceae bacterium]
MKNIVIGVGNLLFKDEGIGIYAAKYLEENYSFEPKIEIIDGGTLGFKLMSYFQEYDNVVILDTVSIEDKAGEIFRIPSDVLLGLGTYRKTAHEVEIVEMLEICSVLEEHAAVTILGIIPEDIVTVEIGLTPTIEAKFEEYVAHVLKECENMGCVAKKINTKSVKQIALELIGSYNGEHLSRIPNEEDLTCR